MAVHGKKYREAAKKVDEETLYTPDDGVQLLKEVAYASFDESVELHARLGIDPRQADQLVRSTVALPHGTGKSVRVLVFAQGDAERVAREAGADHVGNDDIVQQIQDGWLEFDATIAMADMMGKVGGLGRILGRRGLMPNPKSGTVVRAVEDLGRVVSELKGGRVEFRNDRLGLVHTVIGRKSFSEDMLRDNLYSMVDAIMRSKPEGTKGVYCRSLSLSTTMSPGIRLDVATTVTNAAAANV